MYNELSNRSINKIQRYTQLQIDELSTILKNDGVISVPTDTVYGVCARINSIQAYNNLIKVKNRPASKPFPIMCSDINQIKTIAIVNEQSEKIINKFMPGPITIVLPKKDTVDNYITNGKNTIAIRMATSNTLKLLIEKTGCPIFMSSANQSGKDTCMNLEEIELSCPLLDGIMEGNVSFGKGSTIIDCTEAEIKLLRKGPIKIKDILDYLI